MKNNWCTNLFFSLTFIITAVIMFLFVYFNAKLDYTHPLNMQKDNKHSICIIKGHTVVFLMNLNEN